MSMQLGLFDDPAPVAQAAAPVMEVPSPVAPPVTARPTVIPSSALAACGHVQAAADALVAFATTAFMHDRLPLVPGGKPDYREAARLVNVLLGRVESARPYPTVASIAKATDILLLPFLPDIADEGDWLFTDAGLDGPNPSPTGGTYGWVRVCDGVEIEHGFGWLQPWEIEEPTVKSPFAELYAMCRGICALPDGWSGTVACDFSGAIGWIFKNHNAANVPPFIRKLMPEAIRRASSLTSLQLAGHPSLEDLRAGKRLSEAPHYPVSKWNVRCDDLCNEAKKLPRPSRPSAASAVPEPPAPAEDPCRDWNEFIHTVSLAGYRNRITTNGEPTLSRCRIAVNALLWLDPTDEPLAARDIAEATLSILDRTADTRGVIDSSVAIPALGRLPRDGGQS